MSKQYTRSYLSYYKGRTIKRTVINPFYFESGLICEVNYKIKNQDTGKLGRAYPFYILILNSGWPTYNSFFNQYVHALRLDHVKPFVFEQLYKMTGITQSKNVKDLRKVNIDKLTMYDKESKRFYIRNLRPYMKTKYSDCYRTFHKKQFSYIRAVKFLFNF